MTLPLVTPVLPVARTAGVPAFLLASDLNPRSALWRDVGSHVEAVASACAPILGFHPIVQLVPMDDTLAESITQRVSEGASELFVLPYALEFDLLQREALGRAIAEARRACPKVSIHHDDFDPCDSLIVDCLAHHAMRALQDSGATTRAGLILAAAGHGDPSSRAQSYHLMRLLWERLGLATGEVGFLRHERPFLASAFESCAGKAPHWIIVPQMLWKSEYFSYTQEILANFQKSHPESAAWSVADPPADHPAIRVWLTRRITGLWNQKRAREQVRVVSPKARIPVAFEPITLGRGTITSVRSIEDMTVVLKNLMPQSNAERILVKVTWHGYATGTYTDPAALDLLLGALPGQALVLEGHTSSRNSGGATFDWETEAHQNRAWIRQQDAEYLRRTGLAEVLTRHNAQYVNITESFWNEDCAPPSQVLEGLEQRGVKLHHPELAQFLPRILFENARCPMISFAKFKGPTRLSIANMFGLLPEPLRARWHGPNITYMASVCCDLVKLYGTLFDLYAIDEALYTAVRWNRRGLYRSRWGNYDLVENAGIVTASPGLVSADILASRLQGQDVTRSAFFDVVRAELGWDDAAGDEPISPALLVRF